MKKSTKILVAIGTGVAAITFGVITAVMGKKDESEATNNECIEGEFKDVEDSEESTEEE